MPDSAIFSLILGAMVFVLLFGSIFASFWYRTRYHRVFKWNFHGKELMLEARLGQAVLSLGGVCVDEIAANGLRICTLKAYVEGTEVRVRLIYSTVRKVTAEATADGIELPLIYSGK